MAHKDQISRLAAWEVREALERLGYDFPVPDERRPLEAGRLAGIRLERLADFGRSPAPDEGNKHSTWRSAMRRILAQR